MRSRLTLDDRYSGSGGRVLQGILYSAMDDAVWWAAWARLDELPTDVEGARPDVAYPKGVRTDEPFDVEARLVERGEGTFKFEAVCLQGGATCARLRWTVRLRTEKELEAWLAEPALPASIRPILEAALARRRAR